MGARYTATVVGYDPSQDVALIQLQGASGLATAHPATSPRSRSAPWRWSPSVTRPDSAAPPAPPAARSWRSINRSRQKTSNTVPVEAVRGRAPSTPTSDGTQWHRQAHFGPMAGNPVELNGVFFRDTSYGWRVGTADYERGLLYATTDGGASWQRQPLSLQRGDPISATSASSTVRAAGGGR